MAEMVARIELEQEPSAVERTAAHHAGSNFPLAAVPGLRTGLTIDDIVHPAYMVNYNFELTWYNESARQRILGFDTPPPGTESRNIFLLLPHAADGKSARHRSELMRLYVSLGKLRLSKTGLLGIVKNLDRDAAALVDELYEDSDPVMRKMVVDLPCALDDETGMTEAWRVYGIYFREGILIIHVLATEIDPNLLEFISRRDIVVRNLMRKQLPVFSPLAGLVADLQNPAKIRAELPPDEYFSLIDEIWSTMTPIFRKHHGTYGRHVGDGVRYFFLPRPDSNYIQNAAACARELKQEMTKISGRWQLRRNRPDELHLNVGLQEGQEWLGTLQSASSAGFAVPGDIIHRAASVSHFTRSDTIRAIKNLGSQLMAMESARLGSASRGAATAAKNRLSHRHGHKHANLETWSGTPYEAP